MDTIKKILLILKTIILSGSQEEDKHSTMLCITMLNRIARRIIDGKHNKDEKEFFILCLEHGADSVRYTAKEWCYR